MPTPNPEDGFFKLYVTGQSWSNATGDDMVTLKYEDNFSSAALKWTARLSEFTGQYFGSADAPTAMKAWTRTLPPFGKRDEIYVTGYRLNNTAGDADYVTAKYTDDLPDPPGSNKLPRWVISYPPILGSASFGDYPAANALFFMNGYMNVFVTGASNGGTSSDDFLSSRYRDLDTQ